MQLLLNGLADGFSLALLALAAAIVFAGARLIALALGGVFAAVPFVAAQALASGMAAAMAVMLAVMLAMLAGVLLAGLIGHGVHCPLARQHASPDAQVIAGLGVYIVLAQGLAILGGSEPQVLAVGADRIYRHGSLVLAQAQVLLLTVPPLLLLVFFIWLRRSRLGLYLRALADNPVEMQLHGHDTDRLRRIAFMLAGFFTAASALLVAHDSSFDAGMGLHALLLALAAMILGGRHSFAGVVAAALLIGVLRAVIGHLGDTRWQDASTFLLLLTVLLLRPQGLFGRAGRIEASS